MTVRTFQSTHVFNNPNHWNTEHPTEGNRLSRIKKGNILRGCYNNSSVNIFNQMSHAQGFVSRPGRKIHDKEIKVSPLHLTKKLTDGIVFEGTPPNHRIIPISNEECHGDDF